jgi:hypothetical protein
MPRRFAGQPVPGDGAELVVNRVEQRLVGARGEW